jgi:ketosteroid isomerase-like protein
MARHDGAYLARALAPEARWVVCGKGGFAGTYVGRDAIFAVWKHTAEQTGGGLTLEVHDVLANDARAVVLLTAKGQRDGRTMDERQVAIFEIRNGQITEARFVYEDPDAYEAFWTT